jgi:SAM-dependent methyltransferase
LTKSDSDFSYDSIADNYAARVDSAPYNALYERPAMLAELPEIRDKRILDAGCGAGWYAEQLLGRGAIVDGIDASAAMVEYARRRLAGGSKGEVEKRLTLQVADIGSRLPFEDRMYDGIVSPLVLHYLRDWRPALREMHRVLKPEGWLLFSTHHPASDAQRIGTRNYLATEHVVETWDWVGEVQFYRRPMAEIVDSLRDSGFVIDRMIEPVPTDEFRAIEPEAWERIMAQPDFLIIRAKPESGEALVSR